MHFPFDLRVVYSTTLSLIYVVAWHLYVPLSFDDVYTLARH